MKKLQYVLSIGLNLINPEGEEVDYHVEKEYFDTWKEAKKAAAAYNIGEIEGGYSDGVKCVVDLIEVSDKPQEIEFFD